MIKDFEDLIIYKKSRILAKQVFDATKDSPFAHDYRFVQQIRAAAGSIIAIILLKDLKDKAIRNSKIFCILQKAPVEKFVLSLIVLSILGILTKLYISRCIMTARY